MDRTVDGFTSAPRQTSAVHRRRDDQPDRDAHRADDDRERDVLLLDQLGPQVVRRDPVDDDEAQPEDQHAHQRLMRVLTQHRGHDLAARAEEAKIAVSETGEAVIDLGFVEPGLQIPFAERELGEVLRDGIDRIVGTARARVRMAQLGNARIHAIYFTGGSTGLSHLVGELAGAFPGAQSVRGDRYSSVVSGLAITAERRFGVPKRYK